MTETYYGDALKLGQKEYRACVDAGVEPCLPAFDDIVSRDGTATGVDLGLVQVPAEFIVGTKTKGRTTSFARNFMPLLAENTEFATKWEKLCQAHLKEGIRDPIKVYEYMNRFYVEEGNKRVSVLKFFGAVVISAHVTRILPEQNGETENEIYYEFVSFYRYSKVNFIEFSKKGSYAKLQTEMGKEAEEAWTDEDRSRFKKVYYAFREAYEAKGGKKLDSTVGDAMLAYIKVYGYEALCDSSIAEIKKNIAKMWEEVALQQEESPIELKLTPPEEKKPSILARVLPVTGSKTLHVAFLYDKNPETSGWTNGHDLGRQHVQTLFNGQIITETYLDVMEDDPQSVLEQVIAEGNNVVFTTSPRLLPASLRAAVDHPDVTIMNCSLNTSHRYVRTYYARMYEVKFITGVIAGTLTEDGRVGYVCDYPIFGQIAGINAFALGVQMVNPRAKVYLEWSSIGGGKSAIQRLTDRGIQLISSQDLTKQADRDNTSFGLSRITEEGQQMLAVPIWQWGVYYEKILRRILDKSLQNEYESSSKALNYYWGMAEGVVDFACSEAVPESVRKLAGYFKTGICSGTCNPFSGVLHTQSGETIGKANEDLSLEEIINMDYLVDNVEGTIPVYSELTTTGKATVDMVGVEPAAKRTADAAEPEVKETENMSETGK